MQNQEKIAQAIAAYLEKNTEHIWHSQGERMAFNKPCEYPVFSEQSFLQAIAAELAAAIAPHLEAGADFPYDKLFDHMANEHGLTLTNTELGDIIHVARSEGTGAGWEDAPDWAEWRTVNSDGRVTFFKEKPIQNYHTDAYGRKTKGGWWSGDYGKGVHPYLEDWEDSLQQRPS